MVRTTLILVVAAICCAAPAAGDTWPDCTVEMVDGTVHEHVDVAWKLEGYMLGVIAADRREFNLSPVDVARIFDAAGADITEEVADASPADTHFALLGRRRVEPTGIGWALDAGGSLSFTSGFGGYEPAGAFFAGLRRGLGQRWHLRVQYRRQGVSESVPDLSAPLDTWTHEAALLVGWRPVHPRRNRNYAYLEAGPVLVDWNRRWDSQLVATVDGGDPETGFLLRCGVLLRPGDHVGVDLGAVASVRSSLDVQANDTGVVLGLNLAVAVY